LAQAEGSADAERQLIIEFGRRLREARRRAGLSQAEVAARLGIRQGYVSRVELGTENITLPACVRFAQAVGCAVSTEVTTPKPRDRDSAGGFAPPQVKPAWPDAASGSGARAQLKKLTLS
jgi:transcriptional regulator with XRE-family HTH domain